MIAKKNPTSIQPFGIIAAVSRNGIIGVDGDLPWKVPADRRAFEEMTRNKTLIVGRKTLFEGGATGTCDHLAHCRRVVVVSRTLSDAALNEYVQGSASPPWFHVASSVDEALQVAQTIHADDSSNTVADNQPNATSPWLNVDCWIGGGESIYAESLAQAQVLHLTVLNTHIKPSTHAEVARFPNDRHWKDHYRLVSQTRHEANDPISFVTSIYERIITSKQEENALQA